MEVTLQIAYDPDCDQNVEAAKLDRFRQAIFKQGVWRRGENGGLEISL